MERGPWFDILIEDTQHVIRQRLDMPSALMLALTCRHEYTHARVRPAARVRHYRRNASLLARAACEQHWALVQWGMDEAGYARSLGSEFVMKVFAHHGRLDLVARAWRASKPMNRHARLLIALQTATYMDRVCIFAWCWRRLGEVAPSMQHVIDAQIGLRGSLHIFKWLMTQQTVNDRAHVDRLGRILTAAIAFGQPALVYRLLDPARPTNVGTAINAVDSFFFREALVSATSQGHFAIAHWLMNRGVYNKAIEPVLSEMITSKSRNDAGLIDVCNAMLRIYPDAASVTITSWADLVFLNATRLQWISQTAPMRLYMLDNSIVESFAYYLRQRDRVVATDVIGPRSMRDAIPALQWLHAAGYLTDAFFRALVGSTLAVPANTPGLPDAYAVLRDVFTTPDECAHLAGLGI